MPEYTRHYPNSALYSTDFSTPVHIEILDYGEKHHVFYMSYHADRKKYEGHEVFLFYHQMLDIKH
jgi:hypothetical protein